ncbi:MAG: TolC family protein [Alistipes sp.]|nr:TolC family protein [Alistipes sp.]
MKSKYNRLFVLFSAFGLSLGMVHGQVPIGEEIAGILKQIEQNNPELEARRKLRDAQTTGVRLDNNLDDPQVEYVHQWGRPSTAGPASELTVTQSFDFPTVYARRAKLAQKRIEVYGHEYESYRQQVLLEGQELCIRVWALRQKQAFLDQAMEDAERVSELISVKAAQGGANALEENKARFEYISAANAAKLNEIELAEAEGRLNTLNGGLPVSLEGSSLEAPSFIRPYDEMAALYESLSPEMLLAVSALKAAGEEIRVSKSKGLPKLSVGYKRDTGPGEKLNGVVAGMTIPLFSNRHNVQRARAEASLAEAELKRMRNDLQSYLLSLYARAELLAASSEQYRAMLDHTDTIGLLKRALGEGHISVIDYYSQLEPVYDSSLTMIEVMEEYHLTCARINAVLL